MSIYYSMLYKKLYPYLLLILIHFLPSALSFSFTREPEDPMIVVLNSNSTNVEFRWDFNLANGDIFSSLVFKRYEKDKGDISSGVRLGFYQTGFTSVNTTLYILSTNITHGPSSGYFRFTTKDIMKQTNNKDGSKADPRSIDYIYRLEIKIANVAVSPVTVEQRLLLRVHNFAGPTNVSVTEFKEFEVTCSADGKPLATLTVVFSNAKRIKGTKSLKLHITAYRNMTGIYNCTAENDVTEQQTKSAWLDVWFPSWCIIHPGATTVYEQGNVLLNVITTGNPLVNEYIWTHPDGRRLSGNNILTFTASRQDAGIYNVSVYNGVGERSYCKSNVTVRLRTKSPEIRNPDKQVLEVNEGKGISLVCNSSGYPEPNITWTNGGNVIGVGKIYNISRAQKKDSSCYTCTADNGIGQANNVSICLNVQYPPSNVTILPSRKLIISKEGDNIFLRCKSDSNPSPTYTWHHNGTTLTDGQNGNLVFNNINRRQNGTYRCEAKNHLGSLMSDPIEIAVQYLDPLEVMGSSNKTYSQSNPLVLFNLSVNAYPSNASLSCNPSAPNVITVITSRDAGLHTTLYLVVVIIQNSVDIASITCKVQNSVGVQIKTLHFYKQPIRSKEESPTITTVVKDTTLAAVLGVLFALSIVLNILLIAGFLWLRRKDSKRNFGKRSNNRDERGHMNDISLQETSLNATDKDTPTVPEYEPIGRRGLAASTGGIPEYEAVTTRTQQAQQWSGVQTNNPMPQYESEDQHRLPEADSNPPSATYQTIQPRTGDYGSLSPSTRLAPKGTVLTSTGSPTRTTEYQSLQHKGVSPQYQSLDDLSRC